jgi:hypothetical protein
MKRKSHVRPLLDKTMRLLRKAHSRRVLALQKVQNLRLLFVRLNGDDEGVAVSGVPDVSGKSKIVMIRRRDLNPQPSEDVTRTASLFILFNREF